MAVIIGHASINEYGKVSGGQPGDQNKKEVCTRSWYNKPWTYLIRATNTATANKMASACEAACANDNIGYSQATRNSLHSKAKAVNYDLAKIKKPCDADCSSLMTVCAIAAGVKELEYSGNAPTTKTMTSEFLKTGKFIVLTENAYTHSDKLLRRGDILVAPGKHTVMVLTDNQGSTPKTIKMKAKGEDVSLLQKLLVENGYSLEIDGIFGPITERAVKDYQASHALVVDGIVGKKTWSALGVL